MSPAETVLRSPVASSIVQPPEAIRWKMLMWVMRAIGMRSSYCLGLMTPNGAVKRAFMNTAPVNRKARSISASTS